MWGGVGGEGIKNMFNTCIFFSGNFLCCPGKFAEKETVDTRQSGFAGGHVRRAYSRGKDPRSNKGGAWFEKTWKESANTPLRLISSHLLEPNTHNCLFFITQQKALKVLLKKQQQKMFNT